MRRDVRGIAVPAVVLAALWVGGGVRDAAAQVSVNINIGPPPIVVAQPPAVVLVPSTSVYFVPDVSYDVFYYGGYWWSPRGDHWYRASAYNGPWHTISRHSVPGPVYGVPHNYRQVYARERHIPYGQWKKEGRGHDQGYHGGHGEGHGEGHGHGGGGEHGHGEGHGHGGGGEHGHGEQGEHHGRD